MQVSKWLLFVARRCGEEITFGKAPVQFAVGATAYGKSHLAGIGDKALN